MRASGRRRVGNDIRRSWLVSYSLHHREIRTSHLAILGFFSLWHKGGVISCSAQFHTCFSTFPSFTTTASLSFSLRPSLDTLIICLLTLNLGDAGTSVSICFCHGGQFYLAQHHRRVWLDVEQSGTLFSGSEYLDALLKRYTVSPVMPTDPIIAATPRTPNRRNLTIQLLYPSIQRCRWASYSDKRTRRTVPPSFRLQNSKILSIGESDRTASTSSIL
jgi:hypothetical protein